MIQKRLFGISIFCIRLALAMFAVNQVSAQAVRPETNSIGGVLSSDADLKEILIGVGFDPKPLKRGFLITTSQDKWTVYIQVRLSDDRSKIGMNANLGIVEEGSVTGTQWKDLLAANRDIDPSMFYYDKEQKKIIIHRVLDNRAVTVEFIKNQIEQLNQNIRSTKKLWSFAK